MRKIYLALVPLTVGLLGCSGLVSEISDTLGLGGGDGAAAGGAPEGFLCGAGQATGGQLPEHAAGWWQLGDSSGAPAEQLSRFWSFPAATAAMKVGDQQWACEGDGRRDGPYLRLTEDPESWVKGYYEGGDPHGTWKGGAGDEVGEGLAFEGAYSYGERSGGWSFYGEDGGLVARGDYRQDLAHGDWTYTSETAEHSYRYIHGERHGLWRESDPLGESLKTGAYFQDKKHGVWIEQSVDKESGELVETSREVWDMGVSQGADAPDPMAGEAGAREVLGAYLEADLAGGRLSSDGYRAHPVLSDFADATQFEAGDPAYDKAIITRSYAIEAVEITGVTAKIKVKFEEVCEVAAATTAERADRETEVEFTLKQQEGFWRLDTPATEPHPSARAYVDETDSIGSDLSKEIRMNCSQAAAKGGKAGKAGGQEDRPGGKFGKGGKGGKGGKAGRGGRAGRGRN